MFRGDFYGKEPNDSLALHLGEAVDEADDFERANFSAAAVKVLSKTLRTSGKARLRLLVTREGLK